MRRPQRRDLTKGKKTLTQKGLQPHLKIIYYQRWNVMKIWKGMFIKWRKVDRESRNYSIPGDHTFSDLNSGYLNLLVLVEFIIAGFIMATAFLLLMALFAVALIRTWGGCFLRTTTSEAKKETSFYEFIFTLVAVYPKAPGAKEYRKSNGNMDNSFEHVI